MNTTAHAALSGSQKIAYKKTGAPTGFPPLVLLHGFCEDSSIWDSWLGEQPGLTVIRVDLPGFGQSDPPHVATIDAFAAAVKTVLDAEKIQACVLAGHSMGGYTALAFAAAYPEMVVGLALIHSHPYADTPEQRDNRDRGIEMIKSGKKDLYVAQLFPKLFDDAFEVACPSMVEQTISKGREQSETGITNALVAMKVRPDRTAVLLAATYPVLFLLGKNDVLIPYSSVLRIAVACAQSEIYLPEGTAHMGMLEKPLETSQIMHQFWQRCAGITTQQKSKAVSDK